MAGTIDFMGFNPESYATPVLPGGAEVDNGYKSDRDGFDLILRQTELQTQIAAIEKGIRDIEQNSNLSDTEKMFSMQMAMNSWSAVTNLRTNMLKDVADVLKTIARNIA
ncbi:type III secretion system needle protein [Rhizobium sp. PDO1-076]|uniref:EscF/YscF/HrpA family type III secretion system needle major subunit n=1 Tax=Rhizobium sp. PDO1-076 TaxID=1125979 RepID=UPI00024E3911|nr:EscF/YscF/HrpA family type III secretion system needle major subunit [Rhizobium sp. PDO1-076]EHS52677.1 type III secretion system needle protein [Rhizobium sp. PDO1-076]